MRREVGDIVVDIVRRAEAVGLRVHGHAVISGMRSENRAVALFWDFLQPISLPVLDSALGQTR